MTQEENIRIPNNPEQKEKAEITPQEKQKRKKMIVYPVLFLAFAGCMWLIFSPSSDKETPEGTNGFNSDIPLPKQDVIIEDKRKAYEQEQIRERQEEKMRTIQDFAFMLGEENNQKEEFDYSEDEPFRSGQYYDKPSKKSSSSIQSSAYAYQDINRQLGSFYETPKEDAEKEELKKQIEELSSRLDAQQNVKMTADEQFAILERSYQLAAKYTNNANPEPVKQVNTTTSSPNKAQVQTVKAFSNQVVSGLETEISDEDLMVFFTKPRNLGFYTAVGTQKIDEKNTIKACIHEEQTVMNGQNVRLRLLEALQAGNVIIPRNTLFTGTAKIQGERLDIVITSLEYEGTIIPVELLVYDSDGQKGLYVPSSLEREALNEAMASVGAGLGSNFTINQNAGAAIATDAARTVIQGGSQYLSKKLRTAKIKLKANYQVLLYEKPL